MPRPPLEEIDPTACYLWWSATPHTSADPDAIRDVFMFVEDGSELEIKQRVEQETEQAIAQTQTGDGRFFRNVTVASGATIMGDGGVALIIDIASTIKFADQQT
jgi:hypothetical protein